MSFFDNIGKTFSEVGQKGSDVVNNAKLSRAINDEEKKIEKLYCEIGRRYFAMHADNYEEGFHDLMCLIIESKNKIREYQRSINEINGLIECTNCGFNIPNLSSFCPRCGAPVRRQEQFQRQPEQMICYRCKTSLMPGTSFCIKCGAPQNFPQNNEAANMPYGYGVNPEAAPENRNQAFMPFGNEEKPENYPEKREFPGNEGLKNNFEPVNKPMEVVENSEIIDIPASKIEDVKEPENNNFLADYNPIE